MTRVALLLVVLSGLVLAVGPGSAQTSLADQAIVGEWIGQWKSGAGSSGNVYLSVDVVDGEQVRGTMFMAVATPGQGYYNRDVPFSGVVSGTDVRIWVPPALWLSLKIIGHRMQGSVQGQQTFGTVELEKR
jgi:hypothetical protein